MVPDLPLDTANLLGISAWGYVAMFFRLIGGLWARRDSSKMVLRITASLFVFTTLNVAACIADEYNAWVKYRVNPGVEVYFSPLNWAPAREFGFILLSISASLADFLVCWRLYALWDKNRLIVLFPAIVIFVNTVDGIMNGVIDFVIKDPNGGPRFQKAFFISLIILTVLGVLGHLYCTILIVARIWWLARQTNTTQNRGMYKMVIGSMIQSGALYTITMIVYTGLWTTGYVSASSLQGVQLLLTWSL
ncbi:hypothetical protein FRB93_011280 [Tulasnella sp. JGI-2019a]|nr:hypothetical protein FRB93_011280 [Tulasnella sp. JGI-2019a]